MKPFPLLMFATLFVGTSSYAQYSYTSANDGNWANAATWSKSSGFAPNTPGEPLLNTTDNITIAANHTLLIDNDMTFAASNPNIVVNGNLYILGDVIFKLGTITVNHGAMVIVQGDLTMSDACTINNNGTFVVTEDFFMTNSTTVNPGAGMYMYGTRTLTGNGTFSGRKPWDPGNAFAAVRDCSSDPDLCAFATSSTLPVKLVFFEGFVKNDYVELKWETASESNSEEFIIEKSANGTDFYSIGNVAAAGSSNSNIQYSFSDFEPLNIGYYRLKQTDLDGSYYYSNILRLRLDGAAAKIKVYPNPTEAGQYINIELENGETSQIRIFSIDGKANLVNTTTEASSFSMLVDAQIKKGLYVVNVNSKNTAYSDLIIIK